VTRKMATEKLKIKIQGSKIKCGSSHKVLKKKAMNSNLIRQQTKHKNPVHTYLNS
jgi:hypothetical protein